MIKVAIVHPSFGRPQQAFDVSQDWMNAANKPEEVEYLIGLDDNDPTIEEYKRLFSAPTKFGRVEVNVGDSRCSVAAMNRLGTIMSPTTELIIGGADDHAPCEKWDYILFDLLAGIDCFNTIKFIGISDGLREYGVLLCYLVVTRAWYTKFNYFIYPEYDGMFADNDMQGVAERLNCIIHAPQITFQHRHFSIKLSPFDATYARTNNTENWNRNYELYKKRSARNFDL